MLIKFTSFVLLVFSFQTMAKESYELSKDITKKSQFISHKGKVPMSNYLAMNVNYEPIKNLLPKIEAKIGKKLITRKEAHITVITPLEYDYVLGHNLTMDQIEEIALEQNIQSAPFTVKCLGRGKVGNDETYFLVVESEALAKIRAKTTEAFITRRGPFGRFRPYKDFFPHITVGFTKRDLHKEDGVIKDMKSCIADIELK